MVVPATLLLLGVVMSAQVTTIQASPPQAIQPRDPTVKTAVGTGSISGKVIAADTGAPIRRAQVSLSGPQKPAMTYTDDEGRYSFKGLPAATYTLTVNPGSHRAAYLAPDMAVRRRDTGKTPYAARNRSNWRTASNSTTSTSLWYAAGRSSGP